MKKITRLLATVALLFGVVGGVTSVKAEVQTNWDPSDAYATTWNSETNTLSWNKSWANVLYTGFAPKSNENTIEVDLSKYQKIHYNITSLSGTASDDDGAYIDLKVRSTGKTDLMIKLREGENDILFSDYAQTVDWSKILELTVSATYADGAADGAAGSAVITEFYLYTDRWEIQQQQQTVTSIALGDALSLEDVLAKNTLVAMASGNQILYGKANDGSDWGSNQIKLETFANVLNLVEGDDNTSYQFRISEATDAGLTMPDGVSKLYRIKAFKADGTTPFTGPGWNGGNSFFLQEISWTYNVADGNGTDPSFFAITPVSGQTNTYTISSYKKDGTAGYKATVYNKSEWTFKEVSQSTQQEDVDVWVEVQVEDTEDPGVPAVADGWISLISNGDLAGDAVTNFLIKDENGNPEAAVIDATAGRMNGRGIKVVSKENPSNDWGTQFFIKSDEKLKEGQQIHIEFDYRADKAANAATQVHRNPGDYNANVASIDFTVNWKHFSETYDIPANWCKQDGNAGDFYMLSFGFNLSQDRTSNTFYFDNIVMWTEDDPLKPNKVALQNAIDKGNAQNTYARTAESLNALTAAISDGEDALSATTAEEIDNATQAINDAIAGLKLQDGYTNLTKDMYYEWDSATAPTSGSSNPGCDYVIGASTGQPYGNGSVPLKTFADLSTFDKFEVRATGGTPRILLNRDVNEGQWSENETESHLIDNTKGNAESWHAKYYTTEGSNVTVDLKQLAADKGFAHLHTIKTVGGNVTVSDMLLYRTITVGGDRYATFGYLATFGCLYKNVKPNGVKAYAAVYNSDEDKMYLTQVTSVPAGKGVIIEADEAGSYAPTFDVTVSEIDEAIENELKVSNGTVVGDGTIYVLAKGSKGFGFYLLEDGNKVPAGKVYYKSTSNDARQFIGFDEGATAIKTVKGAEAENAIYNMAGQRLTKAQKGLNIVNGKVVLVK